MKLAFLKPKKTTIYDTRYNYHVCFAVNYKNGCFDFQSGMVGVNCRIDHTNAPQIFREAFVAICRKDKPVLDFSVISYQLLGEEIISTDIPDKPREQKKEGA